MQPAARLALASAAQEKRCASAPRRLVALRALGRPRAAGLALWALTRSLEVSDLPRATDPALIVAIPRLLGRRRPDRVAPVREPGRLDLPRGGARVRARAVLPRSTRSTRFDSRRARCREAPGRVGGRSRLRCAALALGTFLLLLFPTGQLTSATLPPRRLARRRLAVRDGAGNCPRAGHAVERYRRQTSPSRSTFPLFSGSGLGLARDDARAPARSGVRVRSLSLRRDGRAAAAPLVPRGGADLHRLVLRHRLGRGAVRCSERSGLSSLPIAAGIAILRYRLYDLDLVLKRTLVYGVATVVLAGLYFGIVLALQQVSPRSPAAPTSPSPSRRSRRRTVRAGPAAYPASSSTVASTAVATMLQRTLESFAGPPARRDRPRRARRASSEHVVQETMQPAQVSLWLRRADIEREHARSNSPRLVPLGAVSRPHRARVALVVYGASFGAESTRARRRRSDWALEFSVASARRVRDAGALVASRRPENAVGWLMCGALARLGVVGIAETAA